MDIYAHDSSFNPSNYFAKEGEKGMTSTSANKLANLAKERNREDMLYVENLKFYSEVMTLLLNPSERVTLSEGIKGSADEFSKIKDALYRIARFNAFISWVREAISAKDYMIREVKALGLKDWCKQEGIAYPEKPEYTLEEDMIRQRASAKIGIEDMARFYVSQAKASVLGQAIHPEGAIDKARRDLIEASLNPSRREGTGQDMVIMTKVATAKSEDVTNFYMSLQADWRQAESEVNSDKGEWEFKDTELRLELLNVYNAKAREYDRETSRIKNEWDKWKLEELRRIGKLKIRIPNLLQPILDELLALGKG